MAEVPTLPEIIEAALDRRLEGVHTAVFGRFTSYSEATQTATIQLQLSDDAGEPVPPLQDVPVTHPGAWASGDGCVVLFSEVDFAADFSEVVSARRHGLHAIAVPVWAEAGQAVDFIALAAKVDAHLETIRTTWTVPTALGLSGPPASGGAPAPLTSVGSTKVKAR